MDILLIILSFILILLGIIGSILPVLPGVPLSYAGIWVLHLTQRVQFSTEFLIFWGIMVLLVQLLDYFIPIWGTKKFGGSKRGMWGSALGMLAGIFIGPWGIIIGPFAGAVLGELTGGKETQAAIKAGFGSFMGFIAGIVTKVIVGGFLLYYAVLAIV